MYIKISSLIFDYILPIKFFCLSDCKKDDKPLHKVEETSSFQIFSNNATVSTWLEAIASTSGILGRKQKLLNRQNPLFGRSW